MKDSKSSYGKSYESAQERVYMMVPFGIQKLLRAFISAILEELTKIGV